MTQTTTGLRAILGLPAVYSAFQRFVGTSGLSRMLASDHLRLEPGMRLLDVGCGPGDLLEELPADVDYTGVDLSAAYVEKARARFGDRGAFHVADVRQASELELGDFDVVSVFGLLHHLDDDAVLGLFRAVRRVLRPGGRAVVVEPCFHERQSFVERFLMNCDRGRNVRTVDAYLELVRDSFPEPQHTLIEGVYRIPWTHVAITLNAPAEPG